MAASFTDHDRTARAHPALGTGPAAVRARIEIIEQVMERSFVIPGIRYRVGLDAIVGVLPVAGDLITGAVGVWLVIEARNLGMSKWAIARMLANVVIDTGLGSIPVAGDLFDLMFRSNSKNLRLIRRHLDRHHPGTVTIAA